MSSSESPASPTLRQLLFVVIGGLFLRLLFLTKESLWLDELASADFTSGTFSRALAAEPTNPPLYYVLLFAFRRLFGASEFALRLPSVVFGTLSIYLVYRLGKGLGRERAAVLAASWTAASSFAIYYSQEVRCFSLLTLLVLISTTAFITLLEPGPHSRRRWLAYIVFTVAALYTHFYAVFYVAGQNLVALAAILRRRLSFRTWFFCQALVVLLFLPWLLKMLSTAHGHVQYRRHLWLKLPQAFFSLLFGDSIIPLDEAAVNHIRETIVSGLPQLLVCCVAAVLLLLCLAASVRKIPDFVLPLLVIALTPIAISFILSFRIMMFDERYLAPSSPLLFLALAGAVELAFQSASPRLRTAAAFSIIGVGCALAFGLQNYFTNPRYGKEQWREAMALVGEKMQESDLLIFEPDYTSTGWDYYGRPGHAKILPVKISEDGTSTEFLRANTQAISTAPRVWLVRSHHRSDEVREALSRELALTGTYPFPRDKGIEVYLFEHR